MLKASLWENGSFGSHQAIVSIINESEGGRLNTIVLDEGASILDVLVIAAKRSLDGLKADVNIQAAIRKNGVLRAPFKYKDLEISQFTK